MSRIGIGVAICHLILVSLNAGGVDVSEFKRVGSLLDYYGMLTGANERYGFFAPGVGGQLGVSFELTDSQGKKQTIPLTSGVSHEADLRLGNILGQFENESTEDPQKLGQALTASLAGTIFGRYPEAKAVTVRVEQFLPISMKEYREGLRPHWSSIYEAKFLYAAN